MLVSTTEQVLAFEDFDFPDTLLDAPALPLGLARSGLVHAASVCTHRETVVTSGSLSLRDLRYDLHSCIASWVRRLTAPALSQLPLAGLLAVTAACARAFAHPSRLTPARSSRALDQARMLTSIVNGVSVDHPDAELPFERIRAHLAASVELMRSRIQSPAARSELCATVRPGSHSPVLVHVRAAAKPGDARNVTSGFTAFVNVFHLAPTPTGWLLEVPEFVATHIEDRLSRSHLESVGVEGVDAALKETMLSLWEPGSTGPLGTLQGALATARAL